MSLLRVSSAITQLASQRSFAVSHIRFSSNDDIMEKRPADKFDKHFIDYLNRPEIDGWEVHKALSELHDFDIIPHPKDVEAALCACRRVNDESELFVPQSKIEYLLEKMMQTQQKSDEVSFFFKKVSTKFWLPKSK
uniref:Cytochrome c oxidase subunit 5A, mitochondrial n=1 Tax=Panagrolaimus davidi TaxID=227884 RepID=A0A914P4Z4_9BILA